MVSFQFSPYERTQLFSPYVASLNTAQSSDEMWFSPLWPSISSSILTLLSCLARLIKHAALDLRYLLRHGRRDLDPQPFVDASVSTSPTYASTPPRASTSTEPSFCAFFSLSVPFSVSVSTSADE